MWCLCSLQWQTGRQEVIYTGKLRVFYGYWIVMVCFPCLVFSTWLSFLLLQLVRKISSHWVWMGVNRDHDCNNHQFLDERSSISINWSHSPPLRGQKNNCHRCIDPRIGFHFTEFNERTGNTISYQMFWASALPLLVSCRRAWLLQIGLRRNEAGPWGIIGMGVGMRGFSSAITCG